MPLCGGTGSVSPDYSDDPPLVSGLRCSKLRFHANVILATSVGDMEGTTLYGIVITTNGPFYLCNHQSAPSGPLAK